MFLCDIFGYDVLISKLVFEFLSDMNLSFYIMNFFFLFKVEVNLKRIIYV